MSSNLLKKGFSLIELMLVLLIMSTILIVAIEEYNYYIQDTKIAKAKADLSKLLKAVRLYNIRESKMFKVATFSLSELGNFVGTYLEKEPPKDPWGNFYLHSPELGLVFSAGPNGKPDVLSQTATGPIDDIILRYLPENFFITKADYVDANQNNLIDFGDYIELRFSRPAKLLDPVFNDFETESPQKAIGTAFITETQDPFVARINFMPPQGPNLILGETILLPREYIDSIVDYSPIPKKLERLKGVIINKKRK